MFFDAAASSGMKTIEIKCMHLLTRMDDREHVVHWLTIHLFRKQVKKPTWKFFASFVFLSFDGVMSSNREPHEHALVSFGLVESGVAHMSAWRMLTESWFGFAPFPLPALLCSAPCLCLCPLLASCLRPASPTCPPTVRPISPSTSFFNSSDSSHSSERFYLLTSFDLSDTFEMIIE